MAKVLGWLRGANRWGPAEDALTGAGFVMGVTWGLPSRWGGSAPAGGFPLLSKEERPRGAWSPGKGPLQVPRRGAKGSGCSVVRRQHWLRDAGREKIPEWPVPASGCWGQKGPSSVWHVGDKLGTCRRGSGPAPPLPPALSGPAPHHHRICTESSSGFHLQPRQMGSSPPSQGVGSSSPVYPLNETFPSRALPPCCSEFWNP